MSFSMTAQFKNLDLESMIQGKETEQKAYKQPAPSSRLSFIDVLWKMQQLNLSIQAGALHRNQQEGRETKVRALLQAHPLTIANTTDASKTRL